MTTATLQMFLEGNPDSTLKNFFRRPFLQKTNGLANSNLGENLSASVATTITTACHMNTSTSNTMSSNSRERGKNHTIPIEGLGFEVTKEETLVFIKAIHIRRSIEPEDLDTQQPFIARTINKKVQTSILWTT